MSPERTAKELDISLPQHRVFNPLDVPKGIHYVIMLYDNPPIGYGGVKQIVLTHYTFLEKAKWEEALTALFKIDPNRQDIAAFEVARVARLEPISGVKISL